MIRLQDIGIGAVLASVVVALSCSKARAEETTGIEAKVVELIERFEALAAEIAPQVVDLGLLTARIAAGSQVFWTTVGLVMMAVFIPLSFIRFKQASRVEYLGDRYSSEHYAAKKKDEELTTAMLATGFFGVVGFLTFAGNFSLFSVVGVFYPQVWIAKTVLGW